MQSNILSGMKDLILVELNVKRPTHRQIQISCGRRCMYVLLEEVSLLRHRLKEPSDQGYLRYLPTRNKERHDQPFERVSVSIKNTAPSPASSNSRRVHLCGAKPNCHNNKKGSSRRKDIKPRRPCRCSTKIACRKKSSPSTRVYRIIRNITSLPHSPHWSHHLLHKCYTLHKLSEHI